MKQECDHLKTKPLDQTNQEIMMDIKHSNNEIRELRESFESLIKSHELLQEHHAEVKKSHEILQNDHRKVTQEMETIKISKKDTAVDRLGGQQMKQECDHLKTKPLDQTNQEIMMDIKHSNNEIRELKESFKSLIISHELLQKHHAEVKKSHEILQDDHRKVTQEMETIKSSQKDTVPWNIRGKQFE
ncbi:unnamed protein product [Mytilus edulis]|uniref:Uncharacterized protein n=1 Tax=Mytilus edulis TaxID=6550 RepID=A0A8S3S927_MYTED|nr:unnamed protein product [Mytilus edulis]